ncbi:Methionine synthase vitamin-B12 independent [Ignisphaera aggregans DSM 17230]|uniref:Methionine synthase vitamin-B12 independent n=1 Tax=Ignisphaera aggregans (strain DSM 17230 / JCM 13409 / AQ1.S1) TaxID=583356 RepID=E0SQQ8_IGNAA|nr:Methionine synthase vitamin-B12 independent [Ignisphaera aggregans DSM 17230]
MRSSHVGSFPLSYSDENIRRIIDDMAKIGLDVPPYPQLRSFIEIYLQPLEIHGVVYRNREFFFSREELLDLTKVRYFHIDDAEIAMKYIRERNIVFKGIRAPITGAFTLASRIYLSEDISKGISSTALANKDILKMFFIGFVENMVRYVAELGYNIIFIDEPSLSLVIGRRRMLFNYREEDIVEYLDRVSSIGGVEFGIHICGPIHRKILEVVAQAPRIRYISLEFHDTSENLEVIDRTIIEKYDKIISPGVVSAKKIQIEELDNILEILRKSYEKTGGRIDLISGDCGFGGFRGVLKDEEREYMVAIKKLENIVKAIKQFHIS